jgi:hypothetical protein
MALKILSLKRGFLGAQELDQAPYASSDAKSGAATATKITTMPQAIDADASEHGFQDSDDAVRLASKVHIQ